MQSIKYRRDGKLTAQSLRSIANERRTAAQCAGLARFWLEQAMTACNPEDRTMFERRATSWQASAAFVSRRVRRALKIEV